ncbi:MAG TPA: glycosyltransferase, partial [Solirubrobacteraceae bacterium]|nr:glycosyltransferase [Solirubrobacteraceae bacterium]
RFPDPSETFVLRELNAVQRRDGVEAELFVLFPPKNPFVHPEAERWVARAHRVSSGAAALGTLWWLAHRPLRMTGSLASVLAGHWRKPSRLARALLASASAAAHARTMRRLEIEHVHAHFATYPALAAWLAGRLLDVPYTFTAHAHDIYIDQLHLRTLVREAKVVAGISEFNRAFLAPYAAGSATPVELVRCGVEPAAYAFRPRALPASGPVRAITVATLNELKGHTVLLDALASGGEDLERVQLDLVGSGPLEPALRAQVARLGLEQRVRFHGTRSEDEVARMLNEADVFVLASVVTASGWMDGIPVALMEALAAGLPVIASRLSGIPELVRDGETGLLALPGDPADLARAFTRLLADPDATIARARAGRRLIQQEFDIERSADRMLQMFGVSASDAAEAASARAG